MARRTLNGWLGGGCPAVLHQREAGSASSNLWSKWSGCLSWRDDHHPISTRASRLPPLAAGRQLLGGPWDLATSSRTLGTAARQRAVSLPRPLGACTAIGAVHSSTGSLTALGLMCWAYASCGQGWPRQTPALGGHVKLGFALPGRHGLMRPTASLKPLARTAPARTAQGCANAVAARGRGQSPSPVQALLPGTPLSPLPLASCAKGVA